MMGSMSVIGPIRLLRRAAQRIDRILHGSNAAVGAPAPLCHDFGGFMNTRYRAFSPRGEKKLGRDTCWPEACHVLITIRTNHGSGKITFGPLCVFCPH